MSDAERIMAFGSKKNPGDVPGPDNEPPAITDSQMIDAAIEYYYDLPKLRREELVDIFLAKSDAFFIWLSGTDEVREYVQEKLRQREGL